MYYKVIRPFLLYGCVSLFVSVEASANLRKISENLFTQHVRRNTTMPTTLPSTFDYSSQENQDAPKFLHYGDPALYKKSLPFKLPKEMPLVHQTLEQMRLATKGMGNVGLAAPQIGILRQLIMFAIPATHPRYKTDGIAHPLRIMINPNYKPLSDEKNLEWEGCLSVPGMIGQVPRYTHIQYEYTDLSGNMHKIEASHFHARVVQHELDHLDGILFPLLVEDKHNFGFTEAIMASHEFRKSRER